MTRRRKTTQPVPNPPYGVKILLDCISILIAIGDALRATISMTLHLPRSAWRVSTKIHTETRDAVWNWVEEKKHARRVVVEPKKIRRLAPRILKINLAYFSNRLRNLNARISTTLSHTRLTLPKFFPPAFPRFKFQLPKIYWKKVPEKRIAPPPHAISPITTTLSSSPFHLQSFIIGIGLTILFIFVPYNMLLFLRSLPNPQILMRRDLEVTSKIFDRNGQLLYEIYADQNRTPMQLAQIPLHVKEATIAIEDHDFYSHIGISFRGILRSLKEIIVYKRIQGGSTITQQLIKSALLTPEVSIVRKTKEIFLAFWAERIYTKDQILEMYFNQVPYGGTAWGIESAAQTYFRKSVTELSLPEAALLAGLPAAPTEYSPFGNHPEKAYIRQHEVLSRMMQDGIITQVQMDEAIATPLRFAQPRVAIRAPHFVMYVKQLLEERFGPRMVERGGLRITTSLDAAMQEKIEDIVRVQVESLARLRVGNGAALVTNPKTGEILAMVGSRDYFDTSADGNVNIVTSAQQPGSAIKVITYAAALEKGMSAASIISDTPIVYKQTGSPPYTPVNYDGKFHGLVSLRYALANSYNIPAVKLLAQMGVPAMLEKGKQMGVDSWESDPSRYGLSLALGGGEVTMLEMARVYGTLANLGKRQELLPILEVTDYTGRTIEKYTPKSPTDAVRTDVAWIMTSILSDNIARTNAFGPNSALVIPGKTVAVKTGTTNEKRDNWTAGYTPSFVSIVWVGNNDNSPMDPYLTSGVTGAAPIWHDIMVELLRGRVDEIWTIPETIVELPCYFGRTEFFISGTEPPNGRCAPVPTPSPTPTP